MAKKYAAMALAAGVAVLVALGATAQTQPSQPRFQARPADGTGYRCDTKPSPMCECTGVRDCIKLAKSSRCADDIEEKGKGGTCTWDVPANAPPSRPSPANFSAAPRPATYECLVMESKGKPDIAFCDCKGKDDCKALAASGQCTGPMLGDDDYSQCQTK